MATATQKKIDDATLDILNSGEWEGNLFKLTCGQLDRKQYEIVNKVLSAMGGKWHRKSGGHVFSSDDAQADLESAIESRGYANQKQLLGFFETPDSLADEMIEIAEIRAGMTILEPSAGTGQLLKAVNRQVDLADLGVVAVEINSKHNRDLNNLGIVGTFRDFLDLDYSQGGFDRVLMNPPFAPRQADVDHVLHAWKFLLPGGRLIAIMSPGWTFRQNVKSVAFRKLVAHYGEWRPNAAGTFKESGTGVNTVLVILDKRE